MMLYKKSKTQKFMLILQHIILQKALDYQTDHNICYIT